MTASASLDCFAPAASWLHSTLADSILPYRSLRMVAKHLALVQLAKSETRVISWNLHFTESAENETVYPPGSRPLAAPGSSGLLLIGCDAQSGSLLGSIQLTGVQS